jgi:acyl carrier protein
LTRGEIFNNVKQHLGEYLERDVSGLALETPLTMIVPGIDSLQLFEAMLYLEDCFQIKIGDNVLDQLKTVGDLVQLLENALALKSGAY